MATYSRSQILLISFFILFSCLLSVSHGRVPSEKNSFRVRAVNLGGWLVTEGWIKPSLFDAIPNKDLLLWRISETRFNFRVFNKQFVGLDKASAGSTKLVAIETTPGSSETFEIVRKSDDLNRVRIKAPNGYFLQVKTEKIVTADYQGSNSSTWEDDGPSVFLIKFNGRLEGEYQVTNGYGPIKAPQVMRKHWRTFIVEDDFKFVSTNGLNTLRIPVGWWIASDPTPPKPFVAGSLKTLDKAFFWAKKYELKVIIDLHCAPGSQNGWEHSGTRDGTQEWGLTNDTIQQTVAVIDFLASRYAKSPSLLAVELINEPLSPGVSLQNVTTYYKAGYEAVRKHTSSAYVILSNRLGPSNITELLPLASGFVKPVIDVHFYNLFEGRFASFTVDQNIKFIKTDRTARLSKVTASNGPLIFVGEWVAEWLVKGASKRDYQRYAEVQLKVYGRATFGWAYWCLKNADKHWSLEWMIKNGYIKL